MQRLAIMIMSGVDDGTVLVFDAANQDGLMNSDGWTLTIGRSSDNHIQLRHDGFTSRHHALLRYLPDEWWLEDLKSKNHSYIEGMDDDVRIDAPTQIVIGQLFRIGRTWLRIQE